MKATSVLPTLVGAYLSRVVALNYMLHWSLEDRDDAYSKKVDKCLEDIQHLYTAVSSLCSFFKVTCALPEVPAQGDKARLRDCIKHVFTLVETLGGVPGEEPAHRGVAHERKRYVGGIVTGREGHSNIIDENV